MAKYEIMMIISGALNENDAKKVSDDFVSKLNNAKVKITEHGLKQLAYIIKKQTHGYYYQYNFETDDVPVINEFKRLAFLNKGVLRHMIINLEKDYGYKAITNPKKVQKSKKKLEIYTIRKAEYEKIREARMAEINARREARKAEYAKAKAAEEKK